MGANNNTSLSCCIENWGVHGLRLVFWQTHPPKWWKIDCLYNHSLGKLIRVGPTARSSPLISRGVLSVIVEIVGPDFVSVKEPQPKFKNINYVLGVALNTFLKMEFDYCSVIYSRGRAKTVNIDWSPSEILNLSTVVWSS